MAHSIGKTIAELRKAKGWTQIELAEKLNVSDKAVSKWESEGGFPEITQLPVLAKIFDVSIDYLMTGKETEPEIITMSKIELCAKNDDISMLDDVKVDVKDENGKTIVDYIIQYESLQVFTALCTKKSLGVGKFGILKFIEFALITNTISALDKAFDIKGRWIADDIKGLSHIEEKKQFENREGYNKDAFVITNELLDIIVLDKRVNSDTIDYLLSNQKKRECVWYLVLPYLLHQSYLHNNIELFNKILEVSTVSNQYAYEHFKIPDENSYARNYYHFAYYLIIYNMETGVYIDSLSKKHGLVRVLEKTIKLALDRSDIETVEKLNDLNNAVMKYYEQFKCYIADPDEIRIAKLKMDKSITKEELAIQSTIHSGVASIDELLELQDFKLIKKSLATYPIHLIEQFNAYFQQKEWRTLFQLAVDNNDNALADTIIKGKQEEIEIQLLSYWNSAKAEKFNINKKHLYLIENGRKVDLIAPTYGTIIRNRAKTLEEVITKLQAVKQRIIDELSLKLDKEKTIGDLTKEYFESELAKGNVDMVIIKLCVRLETILRCDYHYEGDLAEMLNQYCSRFNTYDDEDNNYDPYTPKKLHKLRMQRNGIVHSEKCNEKLTLEEIKWCIDYICKMG